MRWVSDGKMLAMQWKDNKPVTMLTSIHDANGSVTVQRNGKLANRWRKIDVLQPKAIRDCKHVYEWS